MPDEVELRTAWRAAVGGGRGADAAFDDVVGRHRQPHRRYHGVRHVTWVVRHVHELAVEVEVADLGAVTAAAFYHDAVYDPRRADNEEQSAALATRSLGEVGWAAGRCATVGTLILSTQHHEPTDDADTGVLADADLAVLGSEPAAYRAYAAGVRAEYCHIDAEAWRLGRAGVLQQFVQRPAIFTTAPGRRRWEARARANVAAELASLVSAGGGAPALG